RHYQKKRYRKQVPNIENIIARSLQLQNASPSQTLSTQNFARPYNRSPPPHTTPTFFHHSCPSCPCCAFPPHPPKKKACPRTPGTRFPTTYIHKLYSQNLAVIQPPVSHA